MSTTPVSQHPSDLPRRVLSLLSAASAACLAMMLALLAFALTTRVVFTERALPGVTAAGVDLSGMNAERNFARPSRWRSRIRRRAPWCSQTRAACWVATPAEIGVSIDGEAVASRALAVGRDGGLQTRLADQSHAWVEGDDIPVALVFDHATASGYLERLAAEIDTPPVEASLALEGLTVRSSPGAMGRQVDILAALRALEPPISRMQDVGLAVPIRETAPQVLDASATAERTQRVLSQEFILDAGDGQSWSLSPTELAGMLEFIVVENPGGAAFEAKLRADDLLLMLEELAPDLERTPQNARFIFNDETRQLDLLTEAVTGRRLDIEATVEAIEEVVNRGESRADLIFDLEEPAVRSDATAEQLGITENVVTAATYFAGSSAERIQNIRTAAAAFHGLLIPPGETVSMAEHLGDISLDTGYTEALIIYGNRTIKGVGGGVCQVSTTLFRAAFFGGYPIVERNPHAYRVLYYEQGPNSPGPGMDATVFVPRVDFKFTNDTPYWLLMETYLYGNQLLWKFYSTSDGRTVDWSSTGPKNVVEAPEPIYRENDDLKKGKIEQVDYEADGMDVVVYRTVSRDGQAIQQDTIKTHYLPWGAIYEFGPGTKLPKDANVED